MPDSLLFDGTDDWRGFTPGNFAGTGALTLAAIVKPTAITSYRWIIVNTADVGLGAFGHDDTGKLSFFDGTTETELSTAIPAADEWYLFAFTKGAGTVTGKFHMYRYSTTTWTQTNASGSNANLGSWTRIDVGNSGGTEDWSGNVLIAGVWDSALADATLQGMTATKQSWIDAAPDEAWRFDTTSTITPFVGTGTQNSTSGATLDAGDAPATWSDGAATPIVTPPFRPLLPALRGMQRFRPWLPFPRPVILGPGGITYAKAGDLLAGVVLAGDGSWESVETGSLTAGTVLAGVSAKVAAGKSGDLIAGTTLSGTDVHEAIESGALLAGTQLRGGDVREAVEAGSLLVGTILSGGGVWESVEAGSLLAGTTLSGADASTFSDTGSLTTKAILAGTSAKEGAGKAGSLMAGTQLRGADAAEHSRMNTLATFGFLAGPDSTQRTKAGSLTVGTTLAGGRVGIFNRAGALLTRPFLSGEVERLGLPAFIGRMGSLWRGITRSRQTGETASGQTGATRSSETGETASEQTGNVGVDT